MLVETTEKPSVKKVSGDRGGGATEGQRDTGVHDTYLHLPWSGTQRGSYKLTKLQTEGTAGQLDRGIKRERERERERARERERE